MNFSIRSAARFALASSAALLMAGTAHAELALDPSVSKVTLVSTKVTGDGSTSVAELFRFHDLQGAVDPDGNATITIPLEGIDTGIDIRNERMVKFLFETEQFPEAVISASIPENLMGEGSHSTDLQATLNLRGIDSELALPVSITVQGDKVMVSSNEPILFDTNAHAFSGGLAKLAELAKVFHIPTTVPVMFNLSFTKADG